MAALAVAESQADEPLPVPGRIGAAFRSVRRSTRSSKKGRSAAEKRRRSKSGCPSGISAKISIMLVATDRPMAASGFVNSSPRAPLGEQVLRRVRLERVADRLAEEQVLADRGVVVVASDVEGIDEPVEPVRRERGRTDRRASTMAAASFGSRIGSRVPARPRAWISRSRPAVDTASARRSSRSGSLEREP